MAYEVIVDFLALAMAFFTGIMVGYTYGEDHATTVALKARWEREAKEWDERRKRFMRNIGEEE